MAETLHIEIAKNEKLLYDVRIGDIQGSITEYNLTEDDVLELIKEKMWEL